MFTQESVFNDALNSFIKSFQSNLWSFKEQEESIVINLNSKPDSTVTEQIKQIIETLKKENMEIRFEDNSLIINKTKSNEELVQYLSNQFITISPPAPDNRETLYIKDVADAKVSKGRILFRGDDRQPSGPDGLFITGITPKLGGDLAMGLAFASEAGNVIALTPNMNTAAIFPMKTGSSTTWIYISKIYHGLPIAKASMNLLAAGKHCYSASYPAEVITNKILPENIICAVEITRNVDPDSRAAQNQPTGDFEILSIVKNDNFKEGIDPSLAHYLDYLRDCIRDKTKIPLSLSQSRPGDWGTYHPRTKEIGFLDVSRDLIAQNSKEFPKEGAEAWVNIFKTNSSAGDINQVMRQHPQFLSIISTSELASLLSKYSAIDDSLFFKTLKASALKVIFIDKTDNYAIRNILNFFITHDSENLFSSEVGALKVDSLSNESLVTLLTMCSKSKNEKYENILVQFAENKLTEMQKKSGINSESNHDLTLVGQLLDRNKCIDEARQFIKNFVTNAQDNIKLSLVVNAVAKANGGPVNTLLFEMLLEEIKTVRGIDLFTNIVNPVQSISKKTDYRIISPIISAIKAGNINLVNLWIKSGVSLKSEITPTNKNTPLMTAIRYKQLDIANLILDEAKGNNDNIGFDLKNADNRTALGLFSEEHTGPEWEALRERIRLMSEKAERERVTKSNNSLFSKQITDPILKQAVTLLNDYTKNNSLWSRFIHGHWNRHHVKEVNALVVKVYQMQITTAQGLLDELAKIHLVNSKGALANRINMIQRLITMRETHVRNGIK